VRERSASWRPAVELLENLRYDPGEEGNDDAFARKLVAGIDGYVNDAFGASHRAHASIVGPPRYVPSAAGRLLQREVEVLLGMRTKPPARSSPSSAGPRSRQARRHRGLLETVDALAIGGRDVLHVPRRPGQLDRRLAVRARPGRHVQRLLADASKPIHLPSDIVGLDAPATSQTFGTSLPDGAKGLDIGPARRPSSATS
jgi:phosphoglycerate kinase